MEGGRNRRGARGFTLIELIVVIVILGVTSGVVVYAVTGFTKQSQAAACADDQRSIVDAEERYAAQVGGRGTEDQLVAEHLLRGPSSLHDIVLTSGDYEVTPVGDCISDDVAAGPDAPAAAATIAGASVADGKPVDIHTSSLVVSVEGAPGAAIAHLGDGGFWVRDGDTDAKGIAHLELLEGSYSVRADFNGATSIVSGVAVPKLPFVSFGIARVTVLSDPGARVAHRGNNGEWIDDGTADKSGAVVVSLLPGDYDFRADHGKGQYTRANAGILGDVTVKVG